MKMIYKVISNLVLFLILGLVALLLLPRIWGIQPLAVLSGSMEPSYPVGSLIYVKDVNPQEIEVGDVITYEANGNMRVTHRVVEKDEETGSFRTKGDANDVEDSGNISYTQVEGKPILCIPFLGYMAAFLNKVEV